MSKKMIICFVGPANSTHIVKWCEWFANRGHEIHVISFTQGEIPKAEIHYIDLGVKSNGSDIGKLKYLTAGNQIKHILSSIKPDIINAHYATSYGIAIAMSRAKKYVLSVWGSDIFEFPQKSILHKELLKYSLKKAPYLFSTSYSMANEAGKYTSKSFEITPFGVDMELFNPNKRNRDDDKFVIGTVKTMSKNYGIETIIDAAKRVVTSRPDINLEVRLSGDGRDINTYIEKTKALGLSDKVHFLGRISQEKAAKEWANMDLGIIPSYMESYGVSAIEAQASGTPLLISSASGLLETTCPGVTSCVIDAGNDKQIAHMICQLYDDSIKLKEMSNASRLFVIEKYEVNHCFEKIEHIYYSLLNRSKGNAL